jgi:hypothetical protein
VAAAWQGQAEAATPAQRNKMNRFSMAQEFLWISKSGGNHKRLEGFPDCSSKWVWQAMVEESNWANG